MSYGYEIKPHQAVKLEDFDPDEDGGLKKGEAEKQTEQLGKEMGELLELMYAARRQSLLIILQGRDTGGKDGSIRHFLRYANVQSCRVIPFKAPSEEELAHDFLWRVHPHAPGKGSIALFNRSHYEDVLVVRVKKLVPEEVWRARYDQINAFERLLVSADTLILKFCLHISKKEQEERLLEREKDPTKFWKLNLADWQDRQLWGDYTAAYEEMLAQCSTPEAPWIVVPANKKWYRDLVITEKVVEALRPFRKDCMEQLKEIGEGALREIQAFRKNAKNKKD